MQATSIAFSGGSSLLESTSLAANRSGYSPIVGPLGPVNGLNSRHGVMSTPAVPLYPVTPGGR